jgi:hypothetical protein
MKIKLMIALVILALVFGTVLVACDNGELPIIKYGDKEEIKDIQLLGTGVDNKDKGNLQNPKTDTSINTAPDIDDFIDLVP